MDPIKVQGVTDWPQPTKVKDVQSFIGFMNFYRRFIQNFSEIAHPLHALTRKLKNWLWGAAEQQAFDALKNTITSAPTLVFPSKSGLFRLECDTSNFTTGAVPPNRLYVEELLQYRAELPDPRQRDAGDHVCVRGVEALPRRI